MGLLPNSYRSSRIGVKHSFIFVLLKDVYFYLYDLLKCRKGKIFMFTWEKLGLKKKKGEV